MCPYLFFDAIALACEGLWCLLTFFLLFLSLQWAVVPTGKKTTNRTILNSRRMVFDLDPNFLKMEGGAGRFVEDLLSTSLSFSLSSLERDPEGLVKFLDATSYLRLISLLDFERSSVGAFCLVVNLYHCLLQHSLLLAVNGPLHRRTVNRWMRSTCYEIGGDVFSLAEIQSCIIRGNMSRPVSPKPPYVEASRKSSAYRYYALQFIDPRINFVLVSVGFFACNRFGIILKIHLFFTSYAPSLSLAEYWRYCMPSGCACITPRKP